MEGEAATTDDATTETVGGREMREDEIALDKDDEKVASSWGVLSLVNAITMLLVARWYGNVVLPGSPSQRAGFKLTCDAASLQWRRRWRSSGRASGWTCPWRPRHGTGIMRSANSCSTLRGCTQKRTRRKTPDCATCAKSSTSAEDMKFFLRIVPIKKGETIPDVVARVSGGNGQELDEITAFSNRRSESEALQNVTIEPDRRNTSTENS